MPLQRCIINGKKGWKWGKGGKCYIGKTGKKKAIAQGLAITKGKLKDINDSVESAENFKHALKYHRQYEKNRKIPKLKIKWLYPYSVEREYRKFVNEFLYKPFVSHTKTHIKPNLLRWTVERKFHDSITVIDDFNTEFQNEIDYLRKLDKRLFEENEDDLKNELFIIALSLFTFNEVQFQKIVKKYTGIEPSLPENWKSYIIQSWVNENFNLLRGVDQDYIKNLSTVVNKAYTNGKTKTFMDHEIDSIIRKMKNRYKLVIVDQTSKLEGQLTKKRQMDIGIDTYYWITVGDERVRSYHKTLHGMLCKWGNDGVYSDDNGKTWNSRTGNMFIGIPGEDIRCRCRAQPNFTQLLEEVDNR